MAFYPFTLHNPRYGELEKIYHQIRDKDVTWYQFDVEFKSATDIVFHVYDLADGCYLSDYWYRSPKIKEYHHQLSPEISKIFIQRRVMDQVKEAWEEHERLRMAKWMTTEFNRRMKSLEE